MKRALAFLAVLGCSFLLAPGGHTQTTEYRTALIQGTGDLLIDSTLLSTAMDGRRAYINQIHAYYDNGANTNQILIAVVSGRVALATGAGGRVFEHTEAMTSGGTKSFSFPVNLTSPADSTVYFMISAASSDTLILAVNYRIVGK